MDFKNTFITINPSTIKWKLPDVIDSILNYKSTYNEISVDKIVANKNALNMGKFAACAISNNEIWKEYFGGNGKGYFSYHSYTYHEYITQASTHGSLKNVEFALYGMRARDSRDGIIFNIRNENVCAFLCAMRVNFDRDICEYLLKCGAVNADSVLTIAAYEGNYKAVNMLMKYGASPKESLRIIEHHAIPEKILQLLEDYGSTKRLPRSGYIYYTCHNAVHASFNEEIYYCNKYELLQ